MQLFLQKLYSHINMNSGETLEDMFLIKIESKRTSLTRKNVEAEHHSGKYFSLEEPCILVRKQLEKEKSPSLFGVDYLALNQVTMSLMIFKTP